MRKTVLLFFFMSTLYSSHSQASCSETYSELDTSLKSLKSTMIEMGAYTPLLALTVGGLLLPAIALPITGARYATIKKRYRVWTDLLRYLDGGGGRKYQAYIDTILEKRKDLNYQSLVEILKRANEKNIFCAEYRTSLKYRDLYTLKQIRKRILSGETERILDRME